MNVYINQAINNRPKLNTSLQVGMRVNTPQGLGYISSMGYGVLGYRLNTNSICVMITLIDNPNITFPWTYNAVYFSGGLESESTLPSQLNNSL